MTGAEFKAARITCLKVSQGELAAMMETPKRTIQDIEAKGEEEVRGVYKVCMGLLIERDKWVMAKVIGAIHAKAERELPNGIMSEVEREEDDE